MLMLMALLRHPTPPPLVEKPSENKSLARLITTDCDASGCRHLFAYSRLLARRMQMDTSHLPFATCHLSRSERLPIFCTLLGLSSVWVSRCRLRCLQRRLSLSRSRSWRQPSARQEQAGREEAFILWAHILFYIIWTFKTCLGIAKRL